MENSENNELIKNFPIGKKYQIIYADPPWQYGFSGTRIEEAKADYKVMKTHDICSIPVKDIADENCVLFIWMIWNKLPDCLEVIKSWGFEYKSCAFTWVKKNHRSGTYFWGMGKWTRQNSEVCLIATKGNPKRISGGVFSVVDDAIQRIGIKKINHSSKPSVVRERIVKLCGDIPRIELFARNKYEGWDVWGDEV